MANRLDNPHPADVDLAIASSRLAYEEVRRLPTFRRVAMLLALRDALLARRGEMASLIVRETAKPITNSRVEVDRAVHVLSLSAEEAKRLDGEVIALDMMAGSEGRFGITRRFPIGPILAITPFNFPINLGMHKVGPALAAGNTVLWKPSLITPSPALLFKAIFDAAAQSLDFPIDALHVLTPSDEAAGRMVSNERIAMLSFTGSCAVGWALRARAGNKKVTLELGGNAAVIVAADADLDYAVGRCIAGGYGYAGQTCISVQRILVERSIYGDFEERLVAGVRALRLGDPMLDSTQVGPMVSDKEASRVMRWVENAKSLGASVLCGGSREALMVKPTVLAGVAPTMEVWTSEVFGPVVTLTPYDAWDEAIKLANDSRYGLQAGIFTRDIGRVLSGYQNLEVGGVIVNDVPSYRMDNMPYGGIKDSGIGREGVRYAIEEMTKKKLLVINPSI